MTESQTLLADYATEGSEEAFRELVKRYVDLVYSTAVRLVNGDRHLAEDVAQTVFVDLAKEARRLPGTVMLGGWLHRHTCFVAAKTMRRERRRQNRERQAVEINALRDESEANLAQVAPILDEAINQLGDADRTAILLRFFEQRDFRSVGLALGGNEDAARMRVNRALGKLQSLLRGRGVTLSSAALGTVLATSAVTVAPSAFAAGIANTALAGAAVGSGITLSFLKGAAMTKLKLGIVGGIVAASIATPLIIQQQSLTKAREDNQALREQIGRMGTLEAENGRLSILVAQANTTEAMSKNEMGELLRLRGEVGRLRKQVIEATNTPTASTRTPSDQHERGITVEEYSKQEGIAKLNYAKNWMLAFFFYSEKNQGQFPTNFDQALSYLPEEAKTEHDLAPNEYRPGTPKFGLTPDRYEIVYQGSTQMAAPQTTIVVREKEAWQGPDGGWLRTYGFADGHTEVHKAADGNFEPWEQKHMQPTTQ